MIKPAPNSMWLVIYECRVEVIRVCVSGRGFYAPGQEPCWGFGAVTKWIKEIREDGEYICPKCGLRNEGINPEIVGDF